MKNLRYQDDKDDQPSELQEISFNGTIQTEKQISPFKQTLFKTNVQTKVIKSIELTVDEIKDSDSDNSQKQIQVHESAIL